MLKPYIAEAMGVAVKHTYTVPGRGEEGRETGGTGSDDWRVFMGESYTTKRAGERWTLVREYAFEL